MVARWVLGGGRGEDTIAYTCDRMVRSIILYPFARLTYHIMRQGARGRADEETDRGVNHSGNTKPGRSNRRVPRSRGWRRRGRVGASAGKFSWLRETSASAPILKRSRPSCSTLPTTTKIQNAIPPRSPLGAAQLRVRAGQGARSHPRPSTLSSPMSRPRQS